MSSHALGILIGGVIPIFVFSGANLAVKVASNIGISVGWYILFAGIGVTIAGGILLLVFSDHGLTASSGLFSAMVGFGWGMGSACVVIALNKYGSSISVLTPLFNMNTLVTVLLALWIFAEWKKVHVPQLLIGSVLIVVGGTLVARA